MRLLWVNRRRKHKISKPLLVCTNIISQICEQCITNLEIFFKYIRKFSAVRVIVWGLGFEQDHTHALRKCETNRVPRRGNGVTFFPARKKVTKEARFTFARNCRRKQHRKNRLRGGNRSSLLWRDCRKAHKEAVIRIAICGCVLLCTGQSGRIGFVLRLKKGYCMFMQ